jgi:hypothetical protein
MIMKNDIGASSPPTAGDLDSLWKRAKWRTVLMYGIWVLPFSRAGTGSEVFLNDRKITSEADHKKAKQEAADKLRQAIAGLDFA